MSKVPKENLDRLRRRADFLRARIATHPNRDLSYDNAEISALDWAVSMLTPLVKKANAEESRNITEKKE
jgi:hypothetical protein